MELEEFGQCDRRILYQSTRPSTQDGGQKRQDFQLKCVDRFILSMVATPTLKCRAMVRIEILLTNA